MSATTIEGLTFDVDVNISTTRTIPLSNVSGVDLHDVIVTLNGATGEANIATTDGVFEATVSVDTIYIIMGAFGMLGNLFVVTLMVHGRKMLKKTTNLFIFNQSVLDLLASFFLTTTSLSWGVPDGTLAAEVTCRFWTSKYPLWSLLVSSTYNLLVITMERFMEVVHPIRHKVSFSRGIAHVLIVFVWLIGPIWQIYFFFTSGVIDGKCFVYSIWPNEVARNIVGTLNVVIQFLFPFGVLIYVYSKILFVISNRIQAVHPIAPKNEEARRGTLQVESRGGDRWQGARRNTIKTMIIVATVFVMCWSQNQLYYLMMSLGFRYDFSSPYYHFTVACIFCNSCLNPFVYALKYRELRMAARGLAGQCFRLRTHPAGGLGTQGTSIEQNSVTVNTVNTVS